MHDSKVAMSLLAAVERLMQDVALLKTLDASAYPIPQLSHAAKQQDKELYERKSEGDMKL